MTNNLNILLIAAMLLIVAGCAGESKKREYKRGRLNYVETLRYGRTGVHSGSDWAIESRNFYVSDRDWSPAGIKTEDIGGCEASPNEKVEVLKCHSFARSNATTFILRMNGDKAEWLTASEIEYVKADDLGEWVGDGRWLLFKDFLYNVETSEKKEVRGLPDYPETYFRAAAPDLETILYEETCFLKRYDLPPDVSFEKERDKQCKIFEDHKAKGIVAFWLIDTKTGAVRMLELKKEKYDWLTRQQGKFPTQREWLDYFRQQLVWEKDKDGKDQLKFPN